MKKLLYILPVHNEQTVLQANVARLREHLMAFEGAEIFLVENGSKDASWPLCEELAKSPPVRAFRETSAGIGYAYDRGIREALAVVGPSRDAWLVLTAADLPFAFTDLDGARHHMEGTARILMGSKAHPESEVDRSAKRVAMSVVYRGARRAILGMRVRDSQGSVFLRADLASEIASRVESRGFFYSTELCHYAERAGETIIELPVRLEESRATSTVRPWKHGTEMLRQLLQLRARSSG